MKDIKYFTPNNKTYRDFGQALILAKNKGVNILALDCEVTENSIEARSFVEVRL